METPKIKTKLEHLIELRDTSMRKVISLEAEISLIERSMLILRPDQAEKQAVKEQIRDAAKKEKDGHEKMVDRLDEMIAEESKKQKK